MSDPATRSDGAAPARIAVRKTYKLYVGGAFPRSESGRSYVVTDHKGGFLANAALASRKDARDAVAAARKAFAGWSAATAYNRGQVLYRVAELLEGRRAQFAAEVRAAEGLGARQAETAVDESIDRWVWYAGWADKLAQVRGAANPVAAVGAVLPSWLATPFLLAALGGLLSQMVMGLYSSGLGLLVLGVRVRRSRTVLIDTSLVVLVGSLFTIVHHGFLAPFVSFVELLACPIATWAAVFVVDMAVRRRRGGPAGDGEGGPGLRLWAVLAWLAGTAVGLACTASPLFTGPLALGVFAGSSLGYFLGFFTSGALYLLAEMTVPRRPRSVAR